MSLLTALEDSEQSSSHGWTTSSRFGVETHTPQNQQWEGVQGANSNLYRQLINQNNTGDVPDALMEEEVTYEDEPGQENLNYSQGQSPASMLQQHQHQQQQQQMQQTQHLKHNPQQQHPQQQQQQQQHHQQQLLQQQLQQQQQQQQQQHQQQMHYQQKQVVHSGPKTPQKLVYAVVQSGGNPQQQHQSPTQRHTPSNNTQQMRHNFNQQQQRKQQQQPFQNKTPHPVQTGINVNHVNQKVSQTVNTNQGSLVGIPSEDELNQQLLIQQEQIAANNRQLASLASLGFSPASLPQTDSPQMKNSPQIKNFSNCNYVGTMRVPNQHHQQQQLQQQQQQQQPPLSDTVSSVRQLLMLNNSQTSSKKIDVKLVDNHGANIANNQTRNILQSNPSSVPKPPVITLSSHRPNMYSQGQTMTSPALSKNINLLGNQKSLLGGNVQIPNQSPVQVPSISTNQNQSVLNSPMPKITKQNVVLEGGGQFEEGQAYMIRDKHGNSKTMVWQGGTFHPMEPEKIQHPAIDSSQRGRGRGRGAKGRGRGQPGNLQGNATGVNMTQQSIRGQSPMMNNVRPTMCTPTVRSPIRAGVVRQDVRHQIRYPSNSYRHPSNMVNNPTSLGTPRPQVVQVRAQSPQIQTVQMRPVALQNLMPAAQGSQQKVGPASPTNTVRQPVETEVKPVADGGETVPEPETGTCAESKEDILDKPEDLPNIPKDPNFVAVCQFCGTTSDDKLKCESCKRKFTSATKYVPKNSNNIDGPEEKRRKVENTKDGDTSVTIEKKTFYGKKIAEQNQVYTQILNSSNNATAITTISRNPRIITRGAKRARGAGRGRGGRVFVPETVTISSDEEDGEHHHHHLKKQQQQMSAPATPVSKGNKSPSHADQAECPESPLIPNIPITSKGEQKGAISRIAKMEDAKGTSRPARERSVSPAEILLNARVVRVGTFRGAPVEPVLLSKNGINFFIEGLTESHKFHIYPQEIQQCLARFDDKSTNMLFFLTSQGCGVRTRKDLNIKQHMNLNLPPPDPYFDPCSVDMTHQMITVILDQVDEDTRIEFQKHMDTFKSWGKQGDEGFYMELSGEEADEILKQSSKKTVVSQGTGGMVTTPLVQDHQYSQQGEEDGRQSRSPSPPRIGFVGPIIKLLTYPPPPEKGGHSITNEDLYCLQEGEFLNDVIVDFFLKYLLLEKLSADDRARTHIFSSFFYKRLTQRIRGAAIDDDPCLTLPVKRHARVKTWTRHVDLFKKDFIVIPINEHAHWFLAIICFPGLQEPVENPFIPKPVTTPLIEPTNVPTPPQPTEDIADDNADDMETEDSENPLPPNQQEKNEKTENSENSEKPGEADKKPDETVEKTETEKSYSEPTETSTPETAKPEVPMEMETNTESTPESKTQCTEAIDTVVENNDAQTDTEAKVTPSSSNTSTKSPTLCKPIRGTALKKDEPRPDGTLVGVKQPTIIIFDSLSGPSRSRIVQVLKEYLMVEWSVKKGGELDKGIIKGCVPKVPQQNNFSDCGVFMLQYVESFFEDPIQDFATPMKGIHDWFSGPKIEGKREEIRDLIIELKEKQESKSEAKDNT